jgi:hypothetical protein
MSTVAAHVDNPLVVRGYVIRLADPRTAFVGSRTSVAADEATAGTAAAAGGNEKRTGLVRNDARR